MAISLVFLFAPGDRQEDKKGGHSTDHAHSKTTALAVFCPDSDKGLLELTMRELRKLLANGEEVFAICVPGGPAALAHPDHLRVDHDGLMSFIQKTCGVKRKIDTIFLVSHEGCGYYDAEIRGKIPGCCADDSALERNDLSAIKRRLTRSTRKRVRTFHSSFNPITGDFELREIP